MNEAYVNSRIPIRMKVHCVELYFGREAKGDFRTHKVRVSNRVYLVIDI